MKSVYIYKGFERFWHWSQAALIIFLGITGFEVHDSIHIFGFERAVEYHRIASFLLLGLIAFSIFWHITTGEWRQYLPSMRNLKGQIMYYSLGIFRNDPHPTRKTVLSKLNPLQVLTYLGFKVVIIPVVVISGLFYMYFKQINANNVVVISKYELSTIANWHTLGASLLIIFLIIHVYMTTTGETLTSNIKAMITGYEVLENEETEKELALKT